MYFPDMPGRQSMVIFIAIYQLASKSRVFRHIVVLVSHCGGKFEAKYHWCHIGSSIFFKIICIDFIHSDPRVEILQYVCKS